jgi:hypothetical protein
VDSPHPSPPASEPAPRDLRLWGLALGIGTLFSVLYTVQSVAQQLVRDQRPDILRTFGLHLTPWLGWLVLLPGVYAIARRWPLHSGGFRRHWWRHLLVALAAPFVHAAVVLLPVAWLRGWFVEELPLWNGFQISLINGAVGTLAQYALVAAVCQALLATRAAADGAVRAERLAAQLSDAELLALRAQLQPHFLFNTLNAIAAHVRDEPDLAEEMLERLSALLRLVLQGNGDALVPLGRELELVRHYLGIHEIRFAGRLRVTYDVDADAGTALVPAMLLQPVVENAIVHGVGARLSPTTIHLIGRAEGEQLQLVVSNERGAAPSPSPGRGIGLANTRARLAALYGDRASLDVALRDDDAVVTVRLPLQRTTEPAEPPAAEPAHA